MKFQTQILMVMFITIVTPFLVLKFFTGYAYLFNKTPDKSTFRKARFVLGNSVRVQPQQQRIHGSRTFTQLCLQSRRRNWWKFVRSSFSPFKSVVDPKLGNEITHTECGSSHSVCVIQIILKRHAHRFNCNSKSAQL